MEEGAQNSKKAIGQDTASRNGLKNEEGSFANGEYNAN